MKYIILIIAAIFISQLFYAQNIFEKTYSFKNNIRVTDTLGNGLFVIADIDYMLKKSRQWKKYKTKFNEGITRRLIYDHIKEIAKQEVYKYSDGDEMLKRIKEIRESLSDKMIEHFSSNNIIATKFDIGLTNAVSSIKQINDSTKTFTRFMDGYSFNVPANWKFNENSESTFKSDIIDKNSRSTEAYFRVTSLYNRTYTSIDEIFSLDASIVGPNDSLVMSGDTTFNNIECKYRMYIKKVYRSNSLYTRYYFLKKGFPYILETVVLYDRKEYYSRYFYSILSSFDLKL